nr:MAG TPA: hypothetical protein [Bacteriophage sp.]
MKLGSRAKPAIPPVEPGTYFAVCIGAVDLGEQETTYNNKTRYANQLQIIFELPSELIEIDGEEQPRQLSRRFSVSLSTKSNLRKFIETWYGKKFTDDAIREFDTRELLGKPAMLSVVLSEDGNYANIASAAALPKGMEAPKAKSELIDFDVEEWDDEAFQKLPEWLQELIKKSTQYKSNHLPEDEVSVEAAEQAASQAAEADEGAEKGVVPF